MMRVVGEDAVDEDDGAGASSGAALVVLGAEEVLAAVFDREWWRLIRLARLLLDDRRDAEEVVQEAFVRTLVAWDRLNDRNDPSPYLRQVVVNLSRGRLRSRQVAKRHPHEVGPDAAAAEYHAVANEDQREVLAAVRALPERQRECVVLRYHLDCSTRETATLLGISEGAVKTHLHRGLAAIEATLKDTR
jgi:RNA polymerase sigma-70 factor (sigma-E family)